MTGSGLSRMDTAGGVGLKIVEEVGESKLELTVAKLNREGAVSHHTTVRLRIWVRQNNNTHMYITVNQTGSHPFREEKWENNGYTDATPSIYTMYTRHKCLLCNVSATDSQAL